ncbi:transposable element Tcb2 transposase [Trichonephila clavipes]|nr:transposable element Tcb2 transposase [Trichonephila clavipes]
METVPEYWIHREKPGQDHPRPTTAREDRHLSIIATCNRVSKTSRLSRYLYDATGTRVSRVAVSKRLQEKGLLARRPAVCVPLTSTNSLNTDSRRTFIWRELGTPYLPSNVREIDNYGGRGLMLWACIMLGGRTPLYVFERGSVTGV